MKKKKWMIAVLLMLSISVMALFSLQSRGVSYELTKQIRNFILTFIFPIFGIEYNDSDFTIYFIIRKMAHIIEFVGIGMILYFIWSSFQKVRLNQFVQANLLGWMIAIYDELIQGFSVGRLSLMEDVFIDGVGVFIGMAISVIIMHYYRQSVEKNKNKKIKL